MNLPIADDIFLRSGKKLLPAERILLCLLGCFEFFLLGMALWGESGMSCKGVGGEFVTTSTTYYWRQ